MKFTNRKTVNRAAAAALLALCPVLPALADYSSTILSQGPVGYWHLDETIAPAPQAMATNLGTLGPAEDGAYNNYPTRGVAGPFNGSTGLSVNGIDQWVQAPYDANVNPTSFTIEAWLNAATPEPSGDLTCVLASMHSAPPRQGWLIYQAGGGDTNNALAPGWQLRLYNENDANTSLRLLVTNVVTPGTYYHIVFTFDGTTAKGYVNGVLGNTGTPTGTTAFVPNGDAPFSIGARSDTGFPWAGSAAEVALYGTALSAEKIKSHFDAASTNASGYGTQIRGDNPMLYYRFREPADPPAANLGTAGGSGDGLYLYNATPGQPGPTPPLYPGFGAGNKAVSLDGTGGEVRIPSLNLDTNTVTITAWVKAVGPQVPYASIVLSHAGATDAGLIFDADGGSAVSYNWNGDNAAFNWQSGLSVPDSDWGFIALVVRPSEAELYVADNTNALTFLSATNFIDHVNQNFDGATMFGSDAGTTNFFSGLIDEVAIFDRSLSAGEVYSQYAVTVGNLAPRIFADPQAPPTFFAGEGLNLVVDAGGTPTLTYQWRKNGVPISGATVSAYVNADLALGDAGAYDAVIANSVGSITSQVATVAVNADTAPAISSNPTGRTLYPGGSLLVSVTASGGQLHYQWQKDGTAIADATNSSYVVASVVDTNGGSYVVVVSNQLGTATSTPAAVVNVVTPVAGSYADVVVNDSPESWWRLDEATPATLFDALGRHDGYYTNVTGNPATLGVPGVARGDSDTAVSADGSDDWFGVVPYSQALGSTEFTLECWAKVPDGLASYCPLSFHNKNKKGEFFYSDASSGTWRLAVGAGTDPFLFYFLGDTPGAEIRSNKWMHLAMTFDAVAGLLCYVNGQSSGISYADFSRNIGGPLLIGGIGAPVNYRFKGTVDEVAFYQYALSQDQIQAHFVAALYGSNSAPIFSLQPAAQQTIVGNSISLNALAEGSLPITYQWLKDGNPLSGETDATLTLNSAAFKDAGSYQLQAINPVGTNLSANALVSVSPIPVFVNATNGLVLHLRFDGDYTDSSGHGNNATAQGSPTFVTGRIGSSALHLHSNSTNSIYNYAALGTPQDLLFSSNVDFSISYWVRLPANDTPGDVPFLGSALGAANNLGVTIAPSYHAGGWQWTLNDGSVNKAANGADNSINDGSWHNVVHTFDRTAGQGITYLDGAQVDATPILGLGDIDTGGIFNIGQDPSGTYIEPLTADLDDLGIWRRVLSPIEAQSVYYAGLNQTSFDTYGPVTVSVDRSGAAVVISWQAGTLLQADDVDGPWTPVSSATAPNYVATPGAAKKFYRVKL